MQSCNSCIFRESAEDAAVLFKKDLGVPVCSKFGRPLGKPGMSQVEMDKLATIVGFGCESHDETSDRGTVSRPDFIEAMVAGPAADVILAGMRRDDQVAPTRCTECIHFVQAQVVKDEMGWPLPMCAAKGRLLFPGRNMADARDCEWGVVEGVEFGQGGHQRMSTSRMVELPLYSGAFIDTSFRQTQYAERVNTPFVDPREYPTDKEVTAQDTSDGIRAWRKVINPNDVSKHTFLPIWRSDFFSVEEQVKVPQTGDDEHPELYIDHADIVYSVAAEWMELDETPCLIGAAGTGKTEAFRHMAWLMQLPFERISITRSTEVDDLAGKWVFEDGQTNFIFGRVALAWGKPCVECIDEPNVGPDEVWQFFRPMFDNSKQLVLDAAKGQRQTRDPFCFPGLCMNPSWDPIYVGANELSDADGNRLASLYVDLPPEEIEREILVKRCEVDGWTPDPGTVDKVMLIAGEIRRMIAEGDLTISWGIRPQIAVIRKLKVYDFVTAYRRALLDRLEPEVKQTILDAVRSYSDQ